MTEKQAAKNFVRFPQDPKRRETWAVKVGRIEKRTKKLIIPPDTAVLCKVGRPYMTNRWHNYYLRIAYSTIYFCNDVTVTVA